MLKSTSPTTQVLYCTSIINNLSPTTIQSGFCAFIFLTFGIIKKFLLGWWFRLKTSTDRKRWNGPSGFSLTTTRKIEWRDTINLWKHLMFIKNKIHIEMKCILHRLRTFTTELTFFCYKSQEKLNFYSWAIMAAANHLNVYRVEVWIFLMPWE